MRLIDADALEYELGASERDIYVRDCLEDAPTIEQPQWIPVSKEKPRDGQKVLITYEYQYGTNVTKATFDEMRGAYYQLGYPIDKSSVIAWMPLPKAYEATE